MAANLNSGTVANQATTQRVFKAATTNIWTGAGIWSVFMRTRIKDLAQSGYMWEFGTSTNLYGTFLRYNAGGALDVLVYCSGDLNARTTNGASVISSTSTAYSVAVTCDGVSGGVLASTAIHIYLGSGTGTIPECSYGATGGTSGSAPSVNDQGLNIGNRGGVDRPCEMEAAEVFVWRGVALTPAEIALLDAGADPATIQPTFLVHNLPLVGMDLWDFAANALWATSNAPTAAEFPHRPRTANLSDGFPVPSGLGAYWSAEAVLSDTSTVNNARTVLDLAGTSRPLYRSVDLSRPRFKNANDGKVIAFAVPSNLTGNASQFEVNSETLVNNADVTWFGIHWNATVDGVRQFNDAPVKIGTDANGAMTVTVSGSTYTPLPMRYMQSRPMPWCVTVGGPSSGAAIRTITLYTTEGISTVQTASYTPATGDIIQIGPTASDGDARHIMGMYRMGFHTRAITPTEAASILTFFQGVARSPSRHRGVYLYAGSSSPEGNNANRDAARGLVYQMTGLGTARGYSYGDFGTSNPSQFLTLGGSGTYTLDETVTQAVSGATGKVLYQNGNALYIYDITGTFDATNNVVGGTSAVSRNCTSINNNLNSGLFSTARYAFLKTLLMTGSDGPQVIHLFTDSNAVNSGWSPADMVECFKRLVLKLRADFPALVVHVSTAIPRSGGLGAAMQTYNTALKAAAAAANYTVIPYDTLLSFDFKDAGLSNDNGVFDITGAAYTRVGTGHNDAIHVYEDGFFEQAGLASNALGTTFADTSSGSLGRFPPRFPRF